MFDHGMGERLRSLRERAGLGGAELARLAGLKSSSHVSLIEAGQRESPATETTVRLARVFGVTAEWLASGEGNPPDEEKVKAAVEAAKAVAA